MDVLAIANARKAFGRVRALDGASFSLQQGELLALLGPNGAGKTTLIRAITGRVRLDEGEVRLFGRRLEGRHTARELGIVPQDVSVYPRMTARENLTAFGTLQGLRGRDLRVQVDWALERTGLTDRADEPVKQFSGGMRRRLNIACGIVHKPRVVLLDEPTVGVDPQSRDHIYDVLAELRATGVSLLLTTHHLEEAEARCSRTVIIDRGKVIASGTLPELVDRTVGRHRLVTLRVDAPLDRVRLSGSSADVDAEDGRVVRARMQDVAVELPRLLDQIHAAGRAVEDVDVRGPSLQAVFIHLTGRELRE
ncbi:MAG TPA: ABC transporter ATP-binding protein [Vicinamibacterales bacterium]|nr:ABC transporter ATP-binding protein [Vicinamibacterales bacterium]